MEATLCSQTSSYLGSPHSLGSVLRRKGVVMLGIRPQEEGVHSAWDVWEKWSERMKRDEQVRNVRFLVIMIFASDFSAKTCLLM